MKIIKSPQKDIKAYLTNKLNIEIFESYQFYCENSKVDILDIFNFIYTEVNFFIQNKNDYVVIYSYFKDRFNSLEIDKKHFYKSIVEIISYEINKTSNEIELSGLNCVKKIFKDYIGYSDLQFIERIEEMYTIEDVVKSIADIEDIEEKILEVINIKTLFMKDTIQYSNDVENFKFVKKCDLEINRLKEIQRVKEKRNTLNNTKATVKKINNINALPPINEVFFIHYQCDNFDAGTKINSLSIYCNGKTIDFKKANEIENIESYISKVNELQNQKLIPVHWNQNRTYYGVDHIKERYFELKRKQIDFEYKNDINLSDWLASKYGTEYIEHPRLDKLSDLNQFNSNSEREKGTRTFDTNRLLLLSKIYLNTLNGTLKTNLTKPIQQPTEKQAQSITKFNPNHFNQKGYDLFLYLVEHYDKKGKVKYINIFKFMKKSINKDKYVFKFTQEKYTAFILSNYNIELKQYRTADGFNDNEKPSLNSHEQQFDGR